MAKQGKCDRCKIYYYWDEQVLLSRAYCIVCSKALTQTTRRCKYQKLHMRIVRYTVTYHDDMHKRSSFFMKVVKES